MSSDAKPFSIRRTVAFTVAAAVLSLMASGFFLFMQAQNNQPRMVGEVTGVMDGWVEIRNARGEVTSLSVPADAEMRGVAALDQLVVGQHVMTRGDFAEDGTFVVEGLRVVRGSGS